MPYEVLTDEEKQKVRLKFEALFPKLNAYFKKQNMPELDYNEEKNKLEARLDNKKMVEEYRLINEIKAKTNDLKAANKEAEDLLKKDGVKFDPTTAYLSRAIIYSMKTDNSKESKEYNYKLLKDYYTDVDGFTRKKIQNILNFDATKILECGDDKIKLLEFYKENMTFSHEAQDFATIANMIKPPLSNEIKEKIEAIKESIEYIHKALPSFEAASDLDFFAFPEFSPELSQQLFENSTKIFGNSKATKCEKAVLSSRGTQFKALHRPLKDYALKMEAKGLVPDKNLFIKYKAIKTDPRTHETKEVKLSEYLDGKPNVKVYERNPDEIDRITKLVPEGYKERVYEAFLTKFKETTHKNEYSYNEIDKEMKGGFFAKIFRRPSNQFNNYMKALKAYNDPKDPDYMNKDRLSKAGKAYMEHVERHGGLDENNMNSTRKVRFNLVKNTMATLDYMEKEKVEDNIYIDLMKDSIVKQPAINEEKIIEDVLTNENNPIIKEPEIQQEEVKDLENE